MNDSRIIVDAHMQTLTRQQNSFSHNMREELDLEKRLLTNEVLSETDDY